MTFFIHRAKTHLAARFTKTVWGTGPPPPMNAIEEPIYPLFRDVGLDRPTLWNQWLRHNSVPAFSEVPCGSEAKLPPFAGG